MVPVRLTQQGLMQDLGQQEQWRVLYRASRWSDTQGSTPGCKTALSTGHANALLWEVMQAGVHSVDSCLQVRANTGSHMVRMICRHCTCTCVGHRHRL